MKIASKLSALAAALLVLTACNSSSDDSVDTETGGGNGEGREVSANLEATQALLDQARADWQAASLQNYVFQNSIGPLRCEDDAIDDDSSPVTNVVVDGEALFSYAAPWYPVDHSEASYTREGRSYERIFDYLQRLLDEDPEIVGRNSDDTESLPEFGERGEVISWFSSEYVGNISCTVPVRTSFLHELDELNYDIVDTTTELETGLQTWLDAGVQDYTLDVRFIHGACEAPEVSGVATVVVVDGEVSDSTAPDDESYNLGTLEEMVFDGLASVLYYGPTILQSAIDDDAAVSFDPNFGYPLSTYAQYITGTENDDWVCYSSGIIVEDLR